MIRANRIKRELAKISGLQDDKILVFASDSDMALLEAKIIGPECSPYENGVFKLEIIIPESYPFTPPSIKFLTRIYHPNIDDGGRICLDLLKMPPKGGWKPSIGIEALLIAIRMLLENPNPDDPLMADIGDEYKRNHSTFLKKAKEYTERYAG